MLLRAEAGEVKPFQSNANVPQIHDLLFSLWLQAQLVQIAICHHQVPETVKDSILLMKGTVMQGYLRDSKPRLCLNNQK